ncbi:telomere-protecting terminal protein Tpg [Streptomyces sp. NPDC020983]|uniref:telomere-protecting terminal protein Tpg n=1 Tax=Streptomyces sp. NPDC020983 TaxID=3365106 RepID=UPI0037A5CFD6
MAAPLGVTRRTVERYLKGTLRQPRRALAARLERGVRKDRQPRVQQRARNTPPRDGTVIGLRGPGPDPGSTPAPGSTDDGRIRRITRHRPPAHAGRLSDAQAAGATEQQLGAPRYGRPPGDLVQGPRPPRPG